MEDSFWTDMEQLNVLPPHFILRVSESIPDIVEYIQVCGLEVARHACTCLAHCMHAAD